jgi:hypothetical protein
MPRFWSFAAGKLLATPAHHGMLAAKSAAFDIALTEKVNWGAAPDYFFAVGQELLQIESLLRGLRQGAGKENAGDSK